MGGQPGNYHALDYISYSAAKQAVAALNNPWDAYASVVGLDGAGEASLEARARIRSGGQSVLDLVQQRIEQLRRCRSAAPTGRS